MNNKLTGVEHNLKIAPEYFAAVVAGVKHAEMRFNDRNYQTGDVLNLCEWDDGTFTGDFVSVDVTHVCELPSVPGYALLSFELQERRKADSEPVSNRYKLDQSGDSTIMVPVEPTPKMLFALWGHRESMRGTSENKIARAGYSNMLAAYTSEREAWLDKLSASWPINHVQTTGEPNNEPTADRLSTLRQHPELITRDEVFSMLAIMESEPVAQATLKRLAVILHGSEVDLNLLTVTAQSLVERCKAGSHPVMYQTRTRPTWNASQPWSLWSECSAESYKETMRFATEPDGAGWVYEGRILHTAPPVPEEIKHHIGGLDWGWEGEFNRGWNACRAAMLQAGNSAVTPDGWIKCSDRTPKTGQAVIGCVDFDSNIVTPLVREFIWTGSTFRRGVCSTGVKSNDSVVVTHWMPLPAAPKKD